MGHLVSSEFQVEPNDLLIRSITYFLLAALNAALQSAPRTFCVFTEEQTNIEMKYTYALSFFVVNTMPSVNNKADLCIYCSRVPPFYA